MVVAEVSTSNNDALFLPVFKGNKTTFPGRGISPQLRFPTVNPLSTDDTFLP